MPYQRGNDIVISGGVPKAKLRQGSRVSFNASQIKPQSATPADLKEEIFEEREDIESYPLHFDC